MGWAVTADPERFDEAVEWFRSRIPVTEAFASEVADYAGSRAWTIAGVSQLEVVQHAFDSLAKAIEDGTPFDTWKAALEKELADVWGKKNKARSASLTLVFRNATAQAYNAGRWAQMQDPAIRALRPYLMFDGVADERQTPICQQWDGTIRPVDDQVWLTAHPQMHHACRSTLRTLREVDALRRGVTPPDAIPDETADEGFGKVPTESEWAPERSDYTRELFEEYRLKREELERQSARPRLDE